MFFMAIARKRKKIIRSSKGKSRPGVLTKAEMVKKMLADQETIRNAFQNGTPLKELEKKHGFKFATLPDPKN